MHLSLTHALDSDAKLSKRFMPHQVAWICGEKAIHDQHKQVVALAQKSVRIGWTYADAFKNVRKRLWFKNRDYLFATKDYPSALEYVQQCYKFAEIFDITRFVTSHGEESLSLNRLDDFDRPSRFTEDVKVGVIRFDNGSRIIAFSANPQAMSVYGGDVGLDEFAKHPNARLLWETAEARVTWGYDLAVWSSHDGEDTLFNEFARQARRASGGGRVASGEGRAGSGEWRVASDKTEGATSAARSMVRIGSAAWNLYFKVTMVDAIELGLLDTINRVQGTRFTPEQFLADCRARAGSEEIFQQTYLCDPLGAATNHIVDWSAIERCRYDYEIERVHLEAGDIVRQFGEFNLAREEERQRQIGQFIRRSFPALFGDAPGADPRVAHRNARFRLGFDVAASGLGDLAVMYIDQASGEDLWLRALFTCRTEDWDFLKTVLFYFLEELPNLQAAGDETGLGRQICWEAAKRRSYRFQSVNFSSKKHDLGFSLMNQLSVARKRFPRSQQDIAADYFALRKAYGGNKWVFSEGRNDLNPSSHRDIAWAGALATHAHITRKCEVWACVA
jgi:phage FluMu gp28-like protein